jgi:hypothetical protein
MYSQFLLILYHICNKTATRDLQIIKLNVPKNCPCIHFQRTKNLEKMEFDLKSINFSLIIFIYFLHSLKIRNRFSEVR